MRECPSCRVRYPPGSRFCDRDGIALVDVDPGRTPIVGSRARLPSGPPPAPRPREGTGPTEERRRELSVLSKERELLCERLARAAMGAARSLWLSEWPPEAALLRDDIRRDEDEEIALLTEQALLRDEAAQGAEERLGALAARLGDLRERLRRGQRGLADLLLRVPCPPYLLGERYQVEQLVRQLDRIEHCLAGAPL